MKAFSEPTTTILSEGETLAHRTHVYDLGGQWQCDQCGFAEDGVIAWRRGDGAVRMTCEECHLYEDPLRYEAKLVLAWMPNHDRKAVSHLIRLALITSKMNMHGFVMKHAALAMKTKSPEGEATTSFLRALNGCSVVDSAKLMDEAEAIAKEAFANAIEDLSHAFNAGIKAGYAAFPNRTAVLRILAHGSDEQKATLLASLRLIPTEARWSRVERWTMGVSKMIHGLIVSFAERNIPLPEPATTEAAPPQEAPSHDPFEGTTLATSPGSAEQQ